jgi:hypothetical protein
VFINLYYTGTYRDKKEAARRKKSRQDRRKIKQHCRMVLTEEATRKEPVADV